MAKSLKDEFVTRGYVRIDAAVAPDLLTDLRRRMNVAMATHERQATVKLGDDVQAAPLIVTAPLRVAFDALLGSGGWTEPEALEDLRVKLPSSSRPNWWHIDVFERGPETRDQDASTWRASPRCGGVGLLVLLLLSDVGPTDGATAVRAGSHHAIAKRLAAAGDDGLSLGDLLNGGIDAETADSPVVLTTGRAGTAFLCHPMLVHAALSNTGASPSYWALPPIRLFDPKELHL
jgi:Phytanoyl-CoA dioxygenase (PhyH)